MFIQLINSTDYYRGSSAPAAVLFARPGAYGMTPKSRHGGKH